MYKIIFGISVLWNVAQNDDVPLIENITIDPDCDAIRFYFDYFTEYMKKNHLDTSIELDMYEVFTEGVNINTHFKTIEDAYAFMKFVVRGFNGKGLYDDRLEKEYNG